MQNLSQEVNTILEKLGNKDLNLLFPSIKALEILDKISKYQALFLENNVKLRSRMAKVCPLFLRASGLTRNQIMDEKNKLTEGEKTSLKSAILDFALLQRDLDDIKQANQSLPPDKQEEAKARENEFAVKIQEADVKLTNAVAGQDDELMELIMNQNMPPDFSEVINHLKQIGELIGVGDKMADLYFSEQKVLFGTIKALNSFR